MNYHLSPGGVEGGRRALATTYRRRSRRGNPKPWMIGSRSGHTQEVEEEVEKRLSSGGVGGGGGSGGGVCRI